MAVTRIATPHRYVGLSTDVKPTDAPAGSRFVERDTGLTYVWDLTSWGVTSISARANTWTAQQTFSANGVGDTPTPRIVLSNTTAAAAGAQQASPVIRWSGKGWKTDAAAASQAVEFQAYVLPLQGAAAPSGAWLLKQSINGGAYTQVGMFGSYIMSNEVYTLAADPNDSAKLSYVFNSIDITGGGSGATSTTDAMKVYRTSVVWNSNALVNIHQDYLRLSAVAGGADTQQEGGIYFAHLFVDNPNTLFASLTDWYIDVGADVLVDGIVINYTDSLGGNPTLRKSAFRLANSGAHAMTDGIILNSAMTGNYFAATSSNGVTTYWKVDATGATTQLGNMLVSNGTPVIRIQDTTASDVSDAVHGELAFVYSADTSLSLGGMQLLRATVAGNGYAGYATVLRAIIDGGNPFVVLSAQGLGSVGIGTTKTGANATWNLILGGGVTTPVLGTKAQDIVQLAAVDASGGHRRLYIQSEEGSPISLGDDILNFAAATGIVSIGGTTVLSLTTAGLALSALNLTLTGTISATGARVTQSYHTNITSTNAVTVDSWSASKTDIHAYTRAALAILRGIEVIQFRHNLDRDPSGRVKLGVRAESIAEPLALVSADYGHGLGIGPTLDTMGLAALHTKAIQELDDKIAHLERQLVAAGITPTK